MLPPRVPWLRICREAKRCSSSPKSGYSLAQRGVAVGEGGGGADFQAVVERLDALHLVDIADVNHHRQRAVELRDFQRQVGAAGQQAGLRVGVVEVGQVGDGQRHQAAFVAAVEFAGLRRRDGLEAGDGLGLAAVELVLGLVAAGLFGGGEDRAIAGAAAQVAGQGFVGFVRGRGRRCSFAGRTATSQSLGCRSRIANRGTPPWPVARCAVGPGA